jgi:hypothetical protein
MWRKEGHGQFSRAACREKNHRIKTDNKSFGIVEHLEYMGRTLTNLEYMGRTLTNSGTFRIYVKNPDQFRIRLYRGEIRNIST